MATTLLHNHWFPSCSRSWIFWRRHPRKFDRAKRCNSQLSPSHLEIWFGHSICLWQSGLLFYWKRNQKTHQNAQRPVLLILLVGGYWTSISVLICFESIGILGLACFRSLIVRGMYRRHSGSGWTVVVTRRVQARTRGTWGKVVVRRVVATTLGLSPLWCRLWKF